MTDGREDVPMNRLGCVCVCMMAVCVAGCPKDKEDDSLTLGEAAEALSEATVSTQASELASTGVELTTNFTIGGAVEAAAQELRTFIASQLPCAEITLSQATLTIKYGANAGNCTYHGHTFSGESSVTVKANDNAQVIVDHTWTNLSDGIITVNGTAHVTWSLSDKTRHVVHELNWKRYDSKIGKGTGDRTQSLLPGGLAEGIRVDGARTWQGANGTWDLAIEGVEMRWADPVPQAGKYVLVTPRSKSLSLSFSRVDADTIRVTIASGSKSFGFNVNKAAGETEPAN